MAKVGIALGGGGVRGLAHMGVLQVLEEEGIPISCITGSSVGAVVGAAYAQTPSAGALLHKFRKTLKEFKFYEDVEEACRAEFEEVRENFWGQVSKRVKQRIVINLAQSRDELFPIEPMIEVVNALVQEGYIEEANIPVGIVALDLHTGHPVVMTEGDVREAVVASSSVTGYIRPLKLGDYLLTDGGAIAPIPVEFLPALGADITIGVDITYTKCLPMSSYNVIDTVIQADTHRAKKISELMINLADIKIRPNTGEIHWSQFSRFEECLEAGMEAGRAVIPELKAAMAKLDEKNKPPVEKKKWWEKCLEYLAEGGEYA